MAASTTSPGSVAQVDFVVDEAGNPIDVGEDRTLKVATNAEQAVGATGPSGWWRLGLVVLLAIVVVLLVIRVMGGNPGTDVVPGTPIAAPQTEQTGTK